MSIARLEDAKKVITQTEDRRQNGWLMELFKDTTKTVLYLTALNIGAFKGYHLHRVRAARYVCVKGKVKITLQVPGTTNREEYLLDSQKPQRLFIPKETATWLLNMGGEEA